MYFKVCYCVSFGTWKVYVTDYLSTSSYVYGYEDMICYSSLSSVFGCTTINVSQNCKGPYSSWPIISKKLFNFFIGSLQFVVNCWFMLNQPSDLDYDGYTFNPYGSYMIPHVLSLTFLLFTFFILHVISSFPLTLA